MADMLTQEWETALIEDYRAHRLERLLELVCQAVRLSKAGRLVTDDRDRLLEQVYQESCITRQISRQRRDRVVNLIQWWDREWFLEWIATHRLPSGRVSGGGTGDEPGGPTP